MHIEKNDNNLINLTEKKMENIEISKIIDGVEVRAITTYAQMGEFGIKLQDSELKASFSSPHIMAMALMFRKFFEQDGTITDYGEEYADYYIDNLWAASQRIIPFKEKINECAIKSAERIIHITNIVDEIIEEFYGLRMSLKSSFKNNGMDQSTYMGLLKIVNEKIDITKRELLESSDKIIIENLNKIEGLLIESDDKCNLINIAIMSQCNAITYEKVEEIRKNERTIK
jgi:uncharacterized protein YaaR (DUF327 family)